MTNQWRNERTMRSWGFSDFMSDTMRNRPEALLLLAAGTALLMTRGRGFGLSDFVSGMSSGEGVASGIGERLHAAADTAAQVASGVRERVGEQVEDLRDTVSDYAERATQRAQEGREALTQTTSEVVERARSTMQENIEYMLHERPLVLGALSLLAGVAIGAALPRTMIETDAMGAAREPLRAGGNRREAFRAAASQAGEKVMEAISGGASEAERAREAAGRGASQHS